MKIDNLINIFFSKCESFIVRWDRVNWIKTIYVNFRSLPFPIAIKFPVYIYGRCKIFSLSGNFEIEGKIKSGMIKLGLSSIKSKNSVSIIDNIGTIHFFNKATIRRGFKITVSKSAFLSIGNNVLISDNVEITSKKSIIIGEGVRFANNVVVMDTDFHFLVNTISGEVKGNSKEIKIGSYNWIGGFVTIKKGTKTPDYTIVVGPYSTIGKDYTTIIEPYSLIGGNPAKLIKIGYLRVFDERSENEVIKHYSKSDEIFKIDIANTHSFCLYN
jgi:acetyltransferase-like isoleucine patch superfamily enzyme